MDELRARLRRVEDDARAARYLAGGADRDTAELRAELKELRAEVRTFRDQNNRVLSAMREDMTDGFTEMRRGFAIAAAAQQRIVELLDRPTQPRNDRPDA